MAGCPFDIPRFDTQTKKVYKCTLCIDRVSASLEPACVKSCPTGAIKFGGKHEMLDYAAGKVEKLKGRGFENAMLYDPSGVGGLHMMYVVPRGDRLEDYGLPKRPAGAGDLLLGAVGAPQARHDLGVGRAAGHRHLLAADRPAPPPPEDEAVAEAERLGQRRRHRERCHPEARKRPGDGGSGVATAARSPDSAAAGGRAVSALHVRTGAGDQRLVGRAGIVRYVFVERLVHWFVALTFIALMVSGLALGYPRAYFLSGLFGGGQTMRFLHPWFGVGFTLGIVWMLVAWAKEMRFDAGDREWTRRLKTYATSGHTGLDTGRYNAGQKGYYWVSIISVRWCSSSPGCPCGTPG